MPVISVSEAVANLTAGRLVAIPTETVYGLAGRIDREDSLKSIFTTKSRPFFDPLIVHVLDVDAAKNLTRSWPEIFDLLAAEFWPGPLTLIAPKNSSVSGLITAGLDSVGLRSPRHEMCRRILQGVGTPLAAPSANRFGRTSPTKAEHVVSEFQDAVDVVDGGPCEVGVESTVLTARLQDGIWIVEILRPGGVSQKEIADLLTRKNLKFQIGRAFSTASPGHTQSHYQPSSPVVIAREGLREGSEIAKRLSEMGYSKRTLSWMNLPDDPVIAARVLYQRFRDLSSPSSAIVIEKKSQYTGQEWHAVWDRIERAAILHI